jgi:hypothetical protein
MISGWVRWLLTLGTAGTRSGPIRRYAVTGAAGRGVPAVYRETTPDTTLRCRPKPTTHNARRAKRPGLTPGERAAYRRGRHDARVPAAGFWAEAAAVCAIAGLFALILALECLVAIVAFRWSQ